MERYRVYNDRQYNIGLLLPNGTERVVSPGAYTLMTKEEIEHMTGIAPGLFAGEKQLRLEDRKLAVELGFVLSEDVAVFDAAFIRKQLGFGAAKVKAWLETVTEPYLLEEVLAVVRTMDLPASKLQVIQERVPGQALIQTADE